MHCSKHRALRCGIHAWSIAWSIARCVNWHAWSIAPSILGLPPSLFGPSSTGRCLSFLGGLCSSSQGAAALALQPFVHQAARRRRELAGNSRPDGEELLWRHADHPREQRRIVRQRTVEPGEEQQVGIRAAFGETESPRCAEIIARPPRQHRKRGRFLRAHAGLSRGTIAPLPSIVSAAPGLPSGAALPVAAIYAAGVDSERDRRLLPRPPSISVGAAGEGTTVCASAYLRRCATG